MRKVLGIAAQDIERISLAFFTSQTLEREFTVDGAPETYLQAVHDTLQTWQLTADDLDAVVVVRGPGSFTASRVSTVIANTLAFIHHLPIIALENTTKKSWKELAAEIPWEKAEKDVFVLPLYDRPPHIT
ncbi:MAG: hypothetical protein UY77_C0003G0006 [Candidatus Uhrbacteria bacterium GW2011_GWA2_53_10]|uniref:Gcp-like domain-containing protein n=1 Tax=Candidatus Uhrbacteria bacterium GW2011_GWA2_53_10 TaxID=1618980 RepID=A0A0G1ZXT1_9BACT|nr:MAG: hypothetical protein UY77_C0003G0006 [Candidatus Uhrbacteria bacterium GW2011_GWA2_53_10]